MPNCSGGIGEVKVKDGVNLTKYCLTIKTRKLQIFAASSPSKKRTNKRKGIQNKDCHRTIFLKKVSNQSTTSTYVLDFSNLQDFFQKYLFLTVIFFFYGYKGP